MAEWKFSTRTDYASISARSTWNAVLLISYYNRYLLSLLLSSTPVRDRQEKESQERREELVEAWGRGGMGPWRQFSP